MTHPSNYPLKFKAICIKDHPKVDGWRMFHIYQCERNIYAGILRIRMYSPLKYTSINMEVEEFVEYFTVVKEKDAWDKIRHK
jgi:hypothetical protein